MDDNLEFQLRVIKVVGIIEKDLNNIFKKLKMWCEPIDLKSIKAEEAGLILINVLTTIMYSCLCKCGGYNNKIRVLSKLNDLTEEEK